MENKLKVFVGFDSREEIAYNVCYHSILRRSTIPVEVIPIKLKELRDSKIYTRATDERASTEFTFSRFFVPYLSDFTGQSVFCDCDFLWLCDAKEVLELFNNEFAVQVVKHKYNPTESTKMDGKIQHLYPRKNWSSFVLYNCSHKNNQILIPDFLNSASGSFLHRFQWLNSRNIGSLSHRYNWLEGHYKEPKDGAPKIVHFTRGNVYFKNFQDVDYGQLWKDEYRDMTGKNWTDDMILDGDK